MNPINGTFLHANPHTEYQDETSARFVNRDTPKGSFFKKSTQRDVNFDWSDFLDDGAAYVRLEIPYRKTGSPGGNVGAVSVFTPIDETNFACFFWRLWAVEGWQRDVWRFLCRTRLGPRHWQFWIRVA